MDADASRQTKIISFWNEVMEKRRMERISWMDKII